MVAKIKSFFMAFTGFIIYIGLVTGISYITDNPVAIDIASGLIFAAFAALYTNIVLGPYKEKIIPSRKFLLVSLIVLTAFAVIGWFVGNVLIQYTDPTFFATQGDAANNQSIVVTVFTSIILSPIVEELIFRGCMHRFLSDVNKPLAFILSSFLFAMTHATLAHIFVSFVGGLILSCIYEKTHRLCLSIAAHMIYNTFAMLIGLVVYKPLSFEIPVAIGLGLVLIALVVVLFRTDGAFKIIPKVQLTEEQKRQRAETARIVNEIMSEKKS